MPFKNKTKQLEYAKSRRMQRIEDRICPRCPNKLKDGVSLCYSCRTKGNRNTRTMIRARLERSECAVCRKKVRGGTYQCSDCKAEEITRKNKLKQSRREQGLCITCGLKKDRTLQCKKCMQKTRQRGMDERKAKMAKGLCYYCDKRAINGGRHCLKHLKYQRRHALKLYNKRRRLELCVLCGKKSNRKANCKDCYLKYSGLRRHAQRAGKINRAKIVEKTLGKCAYCDKKRRKMHIDHVIPLAKGGRHSQNNLILACQSCNMSKGSKLVSEWKPNLINKVKEILS